ncbi:HAD family hydrolase [Archangium violaceum]|uniref:HAD family hydrolase n=1 Tax=Archangium violaceum TaxID=83451 RepID=UPI0031B802A1
MSIHAVIFDRDGVLTYFDFAPALELFRDLPRIPFEAVRQHWFSWCRVTGTPRTVEAERQFLAGFWDELCDEWSLDAGVRERFHRFDYTRTIRAFSDARPTLLAVRERGLRVGVLSNFPMASIEASLTAAGLGDLVDVTCAAPVIGASKPEPAAYLHALAALGVSADECLLVDDEEACVEGARAVGIRAFLLDRAASGRGGGAATLGGLEALSPMLDMRLHEGTP